MKTNNNKKQVKSVAKGLVANTMTWKAVAAAINTVETIEGQEAWKALCMLGIHAQQGKVTCKDLQDAWSARLKEEANSDGYKYPQVLKSLPKKVSVNGHKYTLCSKVKGEYKSVHVKALCRVCKAEEVRKNSTDVALTVAVVAKGLEQSVFVTDTLQRLAKSHADDAALAKGYINIGTTSKPKWVAVVRDDKGVWSAK